MVHKGLAILAKKLGIEINDADLWLKALTHRSFAHESKQSGEDNERLEFLGDAVIELAVTEHLYDVFPNVSEGEMALMRTSVVRAESLADAARRLSLGDYLRLGKGEDESGGRERSSLLSDAFEAVVAVMYIEHGWRVAQLSILKVLEPELLRLRNKQTPLDPKSKLQESLQANFKQTPSYRLLKRLGPDHDARFEVEVVFQGKTLGRGFGSSMRNAEQDAARQALKRLGDLEAPS